MNNDKNKDKFNLNFNALKRPRTISVNAKEKIISESPIRPSLFPIIPSVVITSSSSIIKMTIRKDMLSDKIASKTVTAFKMLHHRDISFDQLRNEKLCSSLLNTNRVKKDGFSNKQIRMWKGSESIRKFYENLYIPSNPDDPSSDTYITLIIKSIFTSEKERTQTNAIWTQSTENLIDVKVGSENYDYLPNSEALMHSNLYNNDYYNNDDNNDHYNDNDSFTAKEWVKYQTHNTNSGKFVSVFNKLLDNSNEEYSENSDDKYSESSEGEYSDSSDEEFYIKKTLQLGEITFFWLGQTKENKKRKASYLGIFNVTYYRKYGPSGSFTKAAKGSSLITQYYVKKK
ncbi:13953_t:CDS:2 [Funneliformis caledonium]|uniref:13953_t:CDS:1 n=1 Tax=Funneliformis caledonium TaxID=1117310 RepID=A0A9N9E5F7_9GLOM|nr:13953_t:CDS:2 [Funneliformis caledonium]